MVKVSTKSVARVIFAWHDRMPTAETARAGGPMREYHSGSRPGERGPVVPSTRNMTADDDRALLILSVGPVSIGQINSTMGAYSARILRSMRNLTSRSLATFERGSFRLAAVQ